MSTAQESTQASNQVGAANKYDKISAIIENKPAVAMQAIYTGVDPNSLTMRQLWPHVLGKSPDPTTGNPVEMVLCYQIDDGKNPTEVDLPHPSRKNFRCFRVSELKSIDPAPAPVNWTPYKFKFKNVRKQNSVEDPDVFR